MCSYTCHQVSGNLSFKTKLYSIVRIPLNGYNLVNYWRGEARHIYMVYLLTESCFVKALFLCVDVSNEVTNPMAQYYGNTTINKTTILSACYHSDLFL